MNKSNFFLILISFLFFGCAVKTHKPVTSPVQGQNGFTRVEVRLHDDDKAVLGTSVGAYEKKCLERMSTKGFTRTVCNSKIVGEGKIIKQLENNVSLVEFASTVQISDTTEFEVK